MIETVIKEKIYASVDTLITFETKGHHHGFSPLSPLLIDSYLLDIRHFNGASSLHIFGVFFLLFFVNI